MTEETIFAAALGTADPADRAAYLDAACAGDPALRRRVDTLLASHAAAGFLDAPAARLPTDVLAAPGPWADETRTGPAPPAADVPLDFLAPCDKPGALGRLGHYEVQAVVGRGGMGVVLKAFDEQLHRVVAIKVMAPQLAASATARQRFVREARAQAAVAHEHVVTIHAVEEANGLPYIVMQFVAGQSLQDRLDKGGPPPVPEALRIGMQAAAGLAAAHAQGLVHRDVKPANILLENGVERVKLTDFGLARAADDASLTQSGQVAGTPRYMSPEQAEGKPVDARSDLFSLGSVLYALCTGRPPFRAPTNIAVLKRVCEDDPTPVREVNPEVPEWLADVVARLHAKDPAGRFPTAAEVADLLGRHLAHLQHPSVVPLPAPERPAVASRRGPAVAPAARSRRWTTAAAVLLLLVAGLGTTEATGVTKLRATVVRVFTPDGALVVETDDPAVKVTVEGDGDLVITGAGPQQVRLKPGSYRLHAAKDGRAVRLDHDLVTISRGDRQVVKVRVEGEGPVTAAPKAEAGAFAVLGSRGAGERRFDTLAAAVQSAADGDTIEVRGNGPFVSEPVDTGRIAVVIRAAGGFRPVVRLSPAASRDAAPLVRAAGPLVLEGLELQRLGEGRDQKAMQPRLVEANGPSLHAANCRFRVATQGPIHACLQANVPTCVVRNCEFLNPSLHAIILAVPPGGTWVVGNSVFAGPGPPLAIEYHAFNRQDASLRLNRNTFTCPGPAVFFWWSDSTLHPNDADGVKPITVVGTDNVFDTAGVLVFDQSPLARRGRAFAPAEAERVLPRVLTWRDRRDLFGSNPRLVTWNPDNPRGPRDLAAWKEFWGDTEGNAREGRVRYSGGNLLARVAADPDNLTPEDFRLGPDSAGSRAGKDGKDLGADVDLVGPGAAYERWKKTPDYQLWLKETGQLRPRTAGERPDIIAPLVERLDRGKWTRVFTSAADVKGVPNCTFDRGAVRLANDQHLPIPTPARKDVAVRARVKVANSYAAILVRKNGEKVYYGAWMRNGSMGISLVPAHRDMDRAAVRPTDDFVEFLFVAQGRKLVAIVDRRYVVEVEDGTLAEGPAALQGGPGGAEFRDVEVQELDPP